MEDGSGEALVWFSSDTVSELLMLDAGQWEGLQRHARVKGHVRVYTRGHSMVSVLTVETQERFPSHRVFIHYVFVCV